MFKNFKKLEIYCIIIFLIFIPIKANALSTSTDNSNLSSVEYQSVRNNIDYYINITTLIGAICFILSMFNLVLAIKNVVSVIKNRKKMEIYKSVFLLFITPFLIITSLILGGLFVDCINFIL